MSVAKAVRDATQDAVNGLRVAVIASTVAEADALHQAFEQVDIGDIPRTVSRASGRKSVSFYESGGSIVFRSTNQSGRGMSLDHVYLPADASHRVMEDVAPMVQTSKSPAIIGYL